MMGFEQGYGASIFANGSTLRESKSDGFRTVRLPFGSEYKILLKNTTRLRCKVQILIDGLNISSLGKIVLRPGESSTIERFIDNYTSGKAFKFISREEGMATGALQDPTSNKLGIIEIRFWSEVLRRDIAYPSSASGVLLRGASLNSMQKSAPNVSYSADTGSLLSDALNSNFEPGTMDFASASIGGTAEGSDSSQHFGVAADFETASIPAVIQLRILAPEVAQSQYVVQDGWVVKQPENIRVSNTFRVEKGELWAKLG